MKCENAQKSLKNAIKNYNFKLVNTGTRFGICKTFYVSLRW